ncbi:MAG TPA: hypothetical protein VIB39_03680 [Candidatus Angelobacter sp.]|jgi:hypothetical protein
MKKLLAAVMLLASIAWSNGQTATSSQPAAKPSDKAPGTALEAFLGTRGRMIMKEFYDVGALRGTGITEMKALVISEPNSARKIKGLRVEVTEAGQFERTNTSFIDVDELDSLSQAIAYMADTASKWSAQPHTPYTEIIYTSKGELQIGFFQNGKDINAFCKSGTIGAATAYFNIRTLPAMKDMVDKAVALLKDK